ncbi:MAG: class I SAM-dependent methyltransferase [Vicinamibacterales bacterium]
MKRAFKDALQHTGAYRPASALWSWFEPRKTSAIRAVSGRNARLSAAYLATSPQPKLHIGCGDNELAGWLNTDLNPKPNQVYLNAEHRFPFADSAFDYVYSEHVIEHLTLPHARVMLGECWRVLRPNGVLRIVTPDLLKLTDLLAGSLTALQGDYVEYSITQYGIAGSPARGSHVLNHFVRSWGHQFIYDAETLVDQFRDSGFTGAVISRFNHSTHAALCNLAYVARMPPGLLEYESITVEGHKPAQ